MPHGQNSPEAPCAAVGVGSWVAVMSNRLGVHLSRCGRLLQCCRTAFTFLVSHIGLCGLVVGYSIMGGFAFQALEAPEEVRIKKEQLQHFEILIDKIWNVTNRMNVLHRHNWTNEVSHMLINYEAVLATAVKQQGYDGADIEDPQWTIAGAILYSIIVITTIGYGNVAPKTGWGKIVTIIYAIVGIPLMLLCMSNIGDAMANSFKFLYWKVCCYICNRPQKQRLPSRRYPSTRSSRGSRRYHDDPSQDGSRTSSYRSSGRSNNMEGDEVDTYTRRHLPPAPPDREASRVPVILNKYVMESKEDLRVDLIPQSPLERKATTARLNRMSSHKDDLMDADLLEEEEEVNVDRPVPIWLCVALVTTYLCGGAALFRMWEKWEFFESFYFCFITLTTIGFGDIVPGVTVHADSQITLSLCAVYLLFGMALLAMSFNLVQEQVTSAVKQVGKRIGIIADDDEEEEEEEEEMYY